MMLLRKSSKTTLLNGGTLSSRERVSTNEDKKKEREMRDRLKKNFDSHHKARSLKPLDPGVCVWLPDMSTEGKVIRERAPRSYVIETPSGTFRRNRRHVIPMPAISSEEESADKSRETSEDSIRPTQRPPSSPLDPNVTRTRSGRISRPPQRYSSSGQN